MNVIQMPLGLAASGYFGWVWPTWAHLPWIVVVGAAGLSAHFCMTRAFMLADATLVLPFDYLRLPLAAIIGYVFYDESVGLALVAGAAIIFSGNFYSLRYEARRNKKGGPLDRPSVKADAAA
jgi:drug/metabolite transporter (DMT)-like permease